MSDAYTLIQNGLIIDGTGSAPFLAGPDRQTTDVHLDPVDPHFDLLVDLFNDLIGRVHNPRIAPGAFVRQ